MNDDGIWEIERIAAAMNRIARGLREIGAEYGVPGALAERVNARDIAKMRAAHPGLRKRETIGLALQQRYLRSLAADRRDAP